MTITTVFKRQQAERKPEELRRKVYSNGSEVLEYGNASIKIKHHKVKRSSHVIMGKQEALEVIHARHKFDYKGGKFVKKAH